MKVNKLLLLIGTLAMGITGCSKSGNTTSSSSQSSFTPHSHTTTSSSSSSEEEIPDPGDSLTPPTGTAGFPTEAVSAFLTTNEMTNYTVPEIAQDRVWNFINYTHFPILKMWTTDNTTGTLLEDTYYSTLTDAGYNIKNNCHDNGVGYLVNNSDSRPFLVFKSLGDYFVLYICATEYQAKSTSDGGFPYEALDESLDLQGVANVPTFPVLPLETGWKYRNYFYTPNWKLCIFRDDSNAPQTLTDQVHSLEDDYKALLEDDGWEIDDTYYASAGYFARKSWVEIQFFSWQGQFSMWVYKNQNA